MTSAPLLRHDLRPMTASDLAEAARLSRAVGWPHRLEDLQFVFGVGSGVVAEIDGAVAGTAMWWVFEDRIARLGMVIVDPALQKSGIGKSLMNAVLDAITVPTVMLNATYAGEPLYRRMGFERIGGMMQYQGVATSLPARDQLRAGRIRAATAAGLPAMIALDAEAAGVSRPTLIEALLRVGEATVMTDGGRVTGFAVCREFGRGRVIGPVIGASEDDARALAADWIARYPDSFLRFDVPRDGPFAAWIEGAGYAPIAPAFTMVRGPAPSVGGGVRAYAYVNQALG